jgi:hypothetical protein
MADTKLADLTALTTPSGDDILYIVDDPAGTPLDRKIALNNLFTRGTITADAPVLNMSQTWNNAAVTFTGIKFNAAGSSSTNSSATSLLMDLQVGAASVVTIDKTGLGKFIGGVTAYNGVSNVQMIRLSGQYWLGTDTSQAYFYNSGYSGATFSVGNPTVTIRSDFQLGWSNGAATGSPDTILTRRGAANLRFGAADAAAPVAQTLSVQSVVAGTTNTAGANLTITGSQGTGTGAGGSIIFQVAPAGGSGTAQNALSTALTIANNRTVTIGVAFTVATLPAAGTQGRRAWVTDATLPTFLGTLTGGGAVVCPVFDNGTAWVSA